MFGGIKKGSCYKIFIDGKWISKDDKFDIINPYDGSIVSKAVLASKEDAVKAVNAADMAKRKIDFMDLRDRVKVLRNCSSLLNKNKKSFVDVLVKEAGKPIKDARSEVDATIERLKFCASEAVSLKGEFIQGLNGTMKRKKALIIRKPWGVVSCIGPFNYPLLTCVSKIGPAFAAGNSSILKPSSDDPGAGIMLVKIFEEAGVPSGGINLITGKGSDVGEVLVKNDKVNMVSFTGCSAVGKWIAENADMKKLHLELGGKCPALVLRDCNVELAARECVVGALKFSGQRCDAISRIFVEERIADEFVEKILEEVKKWNMGNPVNEKTNIGPLVNRNAIKKVKDLVADAKKKGAKLLCGGKVDRLFFEPAVLDCVTEKMDIAWVETFGPVVTVIRVKNKEEALELANKSEYGLDASVFSDDINKALELANELEDGSVHLNAHPSHGIGEFPFGGDKSSGIGREGIGISVKEMSKLHTMVLH